MTDWNRESQIELPTEPTPVPDEDVLPDKYPMYGDYWYVIDGKPRRCDWMRTTVAEYKRREGAKEIRRCNIVFRAGRQHTEHSNQGRK